MDLLELNNWLGGFINFERRPDENMLNLSTMQTLCDFFGHPESACPCFHVAGSKGKGTISHNIATILRCQGYKTGVYASPHVYHFTERISTGEAPFAEETYQKAEQELRLGVEELIKSGKLEQSIITWYELVTVYAMLVFRLAKVDYAVYEVGMGGRLDCTNIIKPEAIAVGPIELEHTEYLGDTLEKIATEKAGIFKEKVPIFSVAQKSAVRKVFDKATSAQSAKITYALDLPDYRLADASVAAAAVSAVTGFNGEDLIKATQIAKDTELPGRYEIVKNSQSIPFVLLDGAHTPNSITATLARIKNNSPLDKLFSLGFTDKIRNANLIFACAADKNVEEIASLIAKSGLFNKIYLTRPGDFKKSDLPRAEQAFKEAIKTSGSSIALESSSDYRAIIKNALSASASSNAPLIVLGSFYLLPEVKKLLK